MTTLVRAGVALLALALAASGIVLGPNPTTLRDADLTGKILIADGKIPDTFFREITEDEAKQFRDWANRNHPNETDVDPNLVHPVVRDEWWRLGLVLDRPADLRTRNRLPASYEGGLGPMWESPDQMLEDAMLTNALKEIKGFLPFDRQLAIEDLLTGARNREYATTIEAFIDNYPYINGIAPEGTGFGVSIEKATGKLRFGFWPYTEGR